MAQPVLSSSTPTDGATDVYVNSNIDLVFAETLNESSISKNSIVLLNAATDGVVQYDISYDAAAKKVTVSPYGVLAEENIYKVRLIGTDLAITASSALTSSDDTTLTTTVTVVFTTGTKVFIDSTAVDKDTTDLSLEGDLRLPANIKALGEFDVVRTDPKNHAYDVQTSLDGNNRVALLFSKSIATGSVETGNGSWLTVDAFPMLDDTLFLASGATFAADNSTFSMPAFTGVTASGNYLYANFAGALPKNAGVEISIESGVAATDGATYGDSSYLLTFTTDRYPKIGGVHAVEREIKAATDELNREYVAGLLFKNTIELMNRYSNLDNDAPGYVAHKYVVNRTIVDILDDKELEKALVAGSRRQLGDLLVSVDAVLGKLSIKHARAFKNADTADKTLQGSHYLAKRVNQVMYSPYYDRPDRLWHGVHGNLVEGRWKTYQGPHPAANTSVNRQSKVGPGSDWI
jgi:hypothetical protein